MTRTLRTAGLAVAMLTILASTAQASSSPSVSTGSASQVKQTTAVLNGTVNPNGSDAGYVFEWGTSTSYGYTSSSHSAGSGTKAVAVKVTVSGLLPGTQYHYRLQALNSHGSTIGADRTFTTAGPPQPGVTTGPATAVGTTTATLTGQIETQLVPTTYEFQWGTTTSYGNQTPAPPLSVAASTTPVSVSIPLSGLASGTLFHYRLVAYHPGLPATYGPDEEFLTLPTTRPVPHVSAHSSPYVVARGPFTFTTAGHLTGPSWLPAQFGCTGQVGIRYFLGRRDLKLVVAPVLPDCTFSVQNTFTKLPGSGSAHRKVTLRVYIHFRGNGYLAGAFARTERLTLG